MAKVMICEYARHRAECCEGCKLSVPHEKGSLCEDVWFCQTSQHNVQCVEIPDNVEESPKERDIRIYREFVEQIGENSYFSDLKDTADLVESNIKSDFPWDLGILDEIAEQVPLRN